MNELTSVDGPRPTEHAGGHDGVPAWYGWGSPVGLGLGLLGTGGCFLLLALGLSVLDSIG